MDYYTGAKQMKVYVMTKANPFEPEVYLGVKGSMKEAEKALRDEYPHMKSEGKAFGSYNYIADNNRALLLFIHEEEI